MADNRPITERFWSRTKVGRNGACWEWTGAKNGDGYGVIRGWGRQLLAHRLSFVMHHEDLEDDDRVLHTCDNPGCVNPDHLVKGTQSENIRHMWARGRRSQPLRDKKGLFLRTRIEQEIASTGL